MKDYSETTELEKTLLSDSFIGFFHSRRDQMNSGKKKRECGPSEKQLTQKFSLQFGFPLLCASTFIKENLSDTEAFFECFGKGLMQKSALLETEQGQKEALLLN